MWSDGLELQSITPLIESAEEATSVGSGRCGRLAKPTTLRQLVRSAAEMVGAGSPRMVGSSDSAVTKVALACGSGGSFLAAARRRGCDALITGEATFHTCLEAESAKIGLGLLGHYWSERFAMERLAERLASDFEELTVWPSRLEHDPIQPV